MLNRATYAWTAEDEATLREMAAKGAYGRKIALRLRRSLSSVKKRATLLNVKLAQQPRSTFRFDR